LVMTDSMEKPEERHRPWQGVVVVDMQVDFFNDDELERCQDDLVAACNRVIDGALERGLPVLEVRTVHAADRSTWALNMVDDGEGMTEDGDPGAAPVPGLHHAGTTEGVVLVRKTRDSAFYGTELAEVLERAGVESFLLCGVSTESCIAATATEAYARDFAVALVADATASTRWDLHDHAIDSLREQYRQPAIFAEQAVKALSRRPI
jgi:nicotinamidase-related amidase